MRGTIDYRSKGIRLFGKPLGEPVGCSSTPNPLACCLPASTSASSFIQNSPLTFIKFVNILHVEPVTNGIQNDVELTFVHHVGPERDSNYPTTNSKFKVFTHVFTIDDLCDRVWTRDELAEELISLAYPMGMKDRSRILVLINPNSGKGDALKLFQNEAESILKAAQCQLTIQLTQYHGHAIEIMKEMDINDFDMVLCCSGDGTPHEVLNGLYSRSDRVEAFNKIKVVQIPGGSGNAMTLSCIGTSEPSEAVLRLLKGQIVQCDLMAVSGWKGQTQDVLVSFLSQTYGMIAQADIGTEYMRFLGGIRFDIGVVIEVLCNRKYPCTLAVKWVAKNKEELGEHYRAQMSKTDEIKPLTEDNFKLKYLDQFHSTDEFTDLPEGWEIFDQSKTDHNAIFYSGKMPYIASECNFFPAALPNDGAIDIITFDGRSKILPTAKALLSLDKGLHVWHDEVEHLKVEAFRISPESHSTQKRYISVDGEAYPFVPFQVEILPRVMQTILWRDGGYTETGFSGRL